MITVSELLYRKRRSRKLAAKALRKVRKKYGHAQARLLWKEMREAHMRAYSEGGDAYKAIKPRVYGLEAILADVPNGTPLSVLR